MLLKEFCHIECIWKFYPLSCWTHSLNMESPQTVPKDTLDKQNTPPNLFLFVFLTLSCQNGTPLPPTKRKCLKSSYLASYVLREWKLL
nr:MAG TPA: hypothetical protein [Caudoviricetes sp.]